METMNDSNDNTNDETISPAILAILRDLSCEQAIPSAESDLVIRRAAAARMTRIRRRPRVKWVSATVAAMAACLLIGMYFINYSQPETTQTVDLARDDASTILREVSTLFPGQIQAIHRDATGLHLTLSETPNVDDTMAIVIEIGNNGQIITFSGQTIEIMGRNVTVNADPTRGILLNGQNIEWWNTQHASHLTIRSLST
jgi:hypothetical protein